MTRLIRLIPLILLVSFFGCATAKDLREAQTCKVWEENAMGVNYADLEAGHAIVRQSCIWGNWGCNTKEASFKDSTSIFMTGNLSPVHGIAGEWKNNLLTLSPPKIAGVVDALGWMAGKPTKIENGQVVIEQEALGHKTRSVYFYNKRCKPQEAALGVIVLAYKK